MATFTFTSTPGLSGLNMVATGPALPDFLNNYEEISANSSQITLSDEANFNNRTTLTGDGLEFGQTTIGGETKAAITSGEITEFSIKIGGIDVAEISDLSADAADFYTNLISLADIWEFFLQGNDTVIGGSGNDILVGYDGNDELFGGTGNDELRGGNGIDQCTGGAGADDFVFFVGDDTLIITDFEPGVDDLVLGNLGEGFTVNDLLPFVSQEGSDVVISSGTQEVRFEDTLLSELSGGDVVFV